jgi:FtsH-binding integral membrane protein
LKSNLLSTRTAFVLGLALLGVVLLATLTVSAWTDKRSFLRLAIVILITAVSLGGSFYLHRRKRTK